MPNRCILLVEDNPDDVALVERVLRHVDSRCEVQVAMDGAAAIGRLHHVGGGQGNPPALVLLDLRMSRMDGFEVLRRLRADDRTIHLPVVVFSSSNEERDVLRSMELGANSYVQKPVDYPQFEACIRSIVEYWMDLNLPPERPGNARTHPGRTEAP